MWEQQSMSQQVVDWFKLVIYINKLWRELSGSGGQRKEVIVGVWEKERHENNSNKNNNIIPNKQQQRWEKKA